MELVATLSLGLSVAALAHTVGCQFYGLIRNGVAWEMTARRVNDSKIVLVFQNVGRACAYDVRVENVGIERIPRMQGESSIVEPNDTMRLIVTGEYLVEYIPSALTISYSRSGFPFLRLSASVNSQPWLLVLDR